MSGLPGRRLRDLAAVGHVEFNGSAVDHEVIGATGRGQSVYELVLSVEVILMAVDESLAAGRLITNLAPLR